MTSEETKALHEIAELILQRERDARHETAEKIFQKVEKATGIRFRRYGPIGNQADLMIIELLEWSRNKARMRLGMKT